tara:strand:- start:109 stop:387 length:279 start_codon:yes stop_codon:yes gene_type:complete
MLEVEHAPSQSGRRVRLQAVVTGVTDRGIVQFDFVYGDPDLSVELVLPVAAFREFCGENRCLVTAADPAESAAVLRLVAGSSAPVRTVGALA